MVNTILMDGPSWVLSSLSDLHTMKQGLQSYNYFVTWEDEYKPIVVFTGDTTRELSNFSVVWLEFTRDFLANFSLALNFLKAHQVEEIICRNILTCFHTDGLYCW
jgi:hypothetical protein